MSTNKTDNKKNTAYDDYLNSSAFQNIDSDIAYFERQAKKQSSTAKRGALAKSPAVDARKKEYARASHAKQQPPAEAAAERSSKTEKKRPLNESKAMLIAAFLVSLIIVFASLFTLAGGDKQYSENENRYLAQRPEMSASSLGDGKYMRDMESYLSDQFIGRSSLVKTKTKIDIFLGKKEINDVYLGKKHFLFEKPATYQAEQVKKTMNAINTFASEHKKTAQYFVLAPNAGDILSEYLPANAPIQNRQELVQSMYKSMDKRFKCIDLFTTFSKYDNKAQLYYRTDHHWTTTAAEIAFKQIAANMKLDTSALSYESYAVTNNFQGTLASSSGLFNAKDNIFITVPKTDVKYVVSFPEQNTKSASMFDSKKLKQKNKYEVFFGGNFSVVRIDTTLNSKKVLLVMKDSYANCLVPMLMPYYKSIIMVDPRYYHDDIEQLMQNSAVTDVLWLYNTDTFFTDTSITSLLGE